MRFLGLGFGKSEKALAAMAAATAVLALLETALPSLQSLRQFAMALVLILGGLLAMIRLGRLGAWLIRRFLWRVRHRMVAVFFFVGALPISFGALVATWGVALMLGPITGYMVTAHFLRHSDRIEAVTESLMWQLRNQAQPDRPATVASFHRHAEERFPGVLIQAEFEGVRVSYPEGSLAGEMPSRLGEEWAMLRRSDGLFLTAAVKDGQNDDRVVLAVPVTEQVVQDLMPGLGILSLSAEGRGQDGGGWPVEPGPVVEGGAQIARSGVPPPRHPFDWVVRWPIQSRILDWNTNEFETATYALLTRASALWTTIFSPQGPATFRFFAIIGYLLLATFGASLLVSLVIATSLTRTMTRAVNDLYVGTQHVNKGDFSYRIPVSGSDQVSDLSRSFNTMTRSIEGLIEESKRRQQLEAELEIAREVQSRLFPATPPELDGLELLGICRPARSVSGDFFDYVSLDGGRLAISFGDVSGKGISAALVMASLHSIIRAQLSLLPSDQSQPLEGSAARLVEKANRQLCENTSPEKFSTLFFGAYDAPTGKLTYANAGHLPPLLLRNGSVQPLEINGMIVGAFPFAEYTASSLSLVPGDILVAYTDGITEPENSDGQEFGEDRLRTALARSARQPPREFIESVMDEVIGWTGNSTLQDDMTMLVVKKQ